jgi:tricarballylate dehydrogenase
LSSDFLLSKNGYRMITEEVPQESHDVVVVGCGIAGLSAAIAANQEGAKVLILEKATKASRGGNTKYSNAMMRFPHGPDEYCERSYTKEEFYDDLMRITQGAANPDLAQTFVNQAAETIEWLTSLGVKWVPPGRTKSGYSRAVSGGGEGLIETLIRYVEGISQIKVNYDTPGRTLLENSQGRVIGVRAQRDGSYIDYRCKGVVIASGGFQSNVEMTTKYIGPDAAWYIIRGSRYNTGEGLQMALDIGAQPAGHWGGFHPGVIDARSSKIECGGTNINFYPYGIMVNVHGKRFLDEAADFRDLTYSTYGRVILKQPQGIAFLILDQKVKDTLEANYKYEDPVQAESIERLAAQLGIDPKELTKTVEEFNQAVQPGNYNRRILDGKCTKGIEPPKSNWAQQLDTPPFMAFPVTGGLTFTFGGLKVDTDSRVFNLEGKPILGLYAAGELVGELFYHSYPGGSSILRGAVFGRIAGRKAAQENL